ncbi:putative high mobility group nucleosome-binding domain-containing protein 5 [Scophthalmus maximus]|uniref:Putative high mobility group nucleosome-binding domain-containing protein 5 n=1 Tax=Scophthalmus maximus TaxID=52904 RepID=A0A2U9BY52_SCOMX|nr:putative high mobility group nucleosome-binding domain-containing protein 5 [Scophthalmus maximus]
MSNHNLVVLVLIGFFMLTMQKAQASINDAEFVMIFKNLRDKALQQIKPRDITISANNDQTIKKVYKALFRDLCKTFYSARALLTAMKLQLFDEVIIEALKNHLIMPTKQKNTVARFFSSLGKGIMKPFKSCFCSSSVVASSPN